jgi:hypothetical protein
MLIFFPPFGLSSSCQRGILFTFGSQSTLLPIASASSVSSLFHREIGSLRGSFLATTTSSHQFEVWSATDDTASLPSPRSTFAFGGFHYGESNGAWRPKPLSLVKDFRYAIESKTAHPFGSIRMSISVEFRNHSMAVLDGSLLLNCDDTAPKPIVQKRVSTVKPVTVTASDFHVKMPIYATLSIARTKNNQDVQAWMKKHVGAVVGMSVGFVALITLALIVFWCVRRVERKSESASDDRDDRDEPLVEEQRS